MRYRKPCSTLRRTKFFLILAAVVLSLAVLAPSVSAEEKANEQNGWEFQVAPYMWFVSMDGNVTVRGQKSDVDTSFSDIWDELNIGGMVAFDGRKGNWGFFGDTIYAHLGKDKSHQGIRIDPSVNVLWLTAGGFYRLGTWDFSDTPQKKATGVTVDIFAGGRYTYLDITLEIEDFSNQKSDKNWVDPIVGARTLWDFSERWALALAGSVGGFGVGSDFAWEASGLLGYRFPLFSKKNNAVVLAGYRALSQDYTDGKGDDKFQWDVTLYGPILGLLIWF
jgi:hypothetical protein